MPDLGGRGIGVVVVGCSLVVLIVAMFRPWDPDAAAGGIGFPIACAVALAVALFIGNQSPSRTALRQGALVSLLAAIAFVVGTFVAYEQGWHGLSWDEFGESDPGFTELALTIVFVGLPGAVAGAVLALVGRTTRRFV